MKYVESRLPEFPTKSENAVPRIVATVAATVLTVFAILEWALPGQIAAFLWYERVCYFLTGFMLWCVVFDIGVVALK